WAGSDGGGTGLSTLYNCVLTGNSARYDGGGCWGGSLNNCILVGNQAFRLGGGATAWDLNNCIVYFNIAPSGPNYSDADGPNIMNYCCTMPMPTRGTGNFTNAPLFVDPE